MKIPRRTVLQAGVAIPLFSNCGSDENESDDDMTMNVMDNSRPIVLRSEARLVANSAVEVSAAALMNSSGEPMEIHEFIFSVRPTDEVIYGLGTDVSGAAPTGGQVAIGLSVKDSDDFGYSLTNGQVPLWNFGQVRQLGAESNLQTFAQVTPTPLYSTLTFFTSAYLWKLDHPMYVPAGARIVPVLAGIGGLPTDAMVGICAIGKTVPNEPVKANTKMPWVCAWVSKSFTIAQTGTDESPNNALWNPFKKPVTIERFTGRLPMFYAAAAVAPQNVVTMTELSRSDYYSRVLGIRMRDSVGNPLVRVSTPIRSVFDSATRTWEARSILPAGQYHKVNVQKTALTTVTESSIVSRGGVSIASVGWREVSWKKGS